MTAARKQSKDMAPQQLNEPRPSTIFSCLRCNRARISVLTAVYPAGGGDFDILPCVCRDKKAKP